MNNSMYLRRRSTVYIAPNGAADLLPVTYIAAVAKNVETLGYAFSEPLVTTLRRLTLDDLTTFYEELIANLKMLRGAHKEFRPMYPHFPRQVMDMSEAELYVNAIVHYWTWGRYLPETEIRERLPLFDEIELEIIDLGSESEFRELFGKIAGSNTSLSEQDKEDLTWFVTTYRDAISELMPPTIPQKENMAYVCGLLLANINGADEQIAQYCKTATDVLRLAVAMSGGDVSLADSTKFRSFTRRDRRLLLTLLERQQNPTEDMLRWKERWKRLGERLHPGEHAERFPKTHRAFEILRRDLRFETFNSSVETALAAGDVNRAIDRLITRPGELARRLDNLIRKGVDWQDAVVTAFESVAHKVSTPVLLQVMTHFKRRSETTDLRVFFLKGNLANAAAIEYNLPPLPASSERQIVEGCIRALTERFGALPGLGKVYLDPQLANFLVPFSQRSASKALRTIVRGSRLLLPDADTLRFFIWWKDGRERTDLDLSAVMFDRDFAYKNVIAYYNLKDLGGHHSGDIVSAPEGASEFIDVSIEKLLEAGAAYVVMMVNSYTYQPYCDLPECFAGWMARQEANSGEIFEPKTVRDRFDLTANAGIALPIVFDLAKREAIWCDLSLKGYPRWANNVANNLKGIQLALKAMCSLKKPTLYDLFTIHAKARGTLVETPQAADIVFSVDTGTPFELETIASEYMG